MTDRQAQPLQPPSDPWAATAPVLPPTTVMPQAEPYVIVVERPRKRRWPWVLGTFTALTALCCVGLLAMWAPISKEHPAHLELGTQVAGFSRAEDPANARATRELAERIRRDYGVDEAVVAVLTDQRTRQRRILLIGATKLILDPDGELDKVIKGVTEHRLRDLTDYARLGGRVTCANSKDDENKPVVVCAWIDHGSLGVGIFYGPWTMDACATTLRDIRDAIVRRG